jgi:hypothetical protein
MKADRKNSLFDLNQIGVTRLFDRPGRRDAATTHHAASRQEMNEQSNHDDRD